MERVRTLSVPGRVPMATVRRGPARVAGIVRRLVFVPDGGEGRLVATLDDGTGTLDARVPRSHARDWSPGAGIAAEGALHDSEFVVRAYLPSPQANASDVWIEVVPLPAL